MISCSVSIRITQTELVLTMNTAARIVFLVNTSMSDLESPVFVVFEGVACVSSIASLGYSASLGTDR